ncbi:MAG: DUF4185 domain-containing protein, partial [Candidatus Obscuribacterales bacterium]|nr:DUF4185 domain-containing protein [Candidatus Obscuribacterales bacterium]
MFEIQSINQKASQNEQSSVISYADIQDFSSASLSAKSSKCSCDSSDGSSSSESKAGGGVSSYPDLRIDTKSKEYSREQGSEKVKISESEELPPIEGKVSDLTGRGFADRWAVTATDLGVSTVAPNGKLISVFGDTFS